MKILTKEQYYQKIKEANGYCLHCQRPLTRTISKLLCQMCLRNSIVNGTEEKSVNIPAIGKSTINYQQYLHRTIFGCNADYRYRGLKQNRIKHSITKEDIQIATNKLNTLLLNTSKQYTATNEQSRNPKRILFYSILYYISYYIENIKDFKSDTHFYMSLYKAIRYIIHNHHYKTSYTKIRGYNQTYHIKDIKRDIPILNQIIKPLLLKIDI